VESDAVTDLWGLLQVTLSSGQTYLDRNVMQNVMYQSYPHDRLELLVIDTNAKGPSDTLMYWNRTMADPAARKANDWPVFRYFYYAPDGKLATGGKRNFLNQEVNGDIVIHADNDDIAMANYVSAIVQHFTLAAANASFKLDHFTEPDKDGKRQLVHDTPATGAPNSTTRCCRSAPGQGPLLRDMITQSPYTGGVFLPDGTSQFTRNNGNGKIGALTSYTNSVAKNCTFRNKQIQEEHLFFNCALEKFGVKNLDAAMMPGGNSQLLMRIGHPLSITNMGYFNDRVKWNQLDGDDLRKMYMKIAWWYEFLHEATRPLHVPGLPVKDTMFYNTGDGDLWKEFHVKHPDLLRGGGYPYCDKYVATPGQMWPHSNAKPDVVTTSTSANDCCSKCAAVKEDAKTCIAWTFIKESKECRLMTADPNKMPALEGRGNTDRVSYFYEFESAVHQDACKKCASGFKGTQFA
jgi:hypothetical protein